ncbi:MAG: sulfite exporter TauE/SafE family protein, partial [Burkholderiaceae bacterium]
MMVPLLTLAFAYQGFAPDRIVHMAIATAIAVTVPTSLSSVRAHHAHGAVLWPVWRMLVPGIVVGSLLGPQIVEGISTALLAAVFAVIASITATQMLIDRKPKAGRELPGTWGLLGTGFGIGLMSSMFGAGGAFISVPFMTWCNIKIQYAVATSGALGLPIAVAGTFGFVFAGWHESGLPRYSLGYIYLPALLAISVGSVLLAPVGARLAHRWPVKKLRRAFACLLFVLAAVMVWKA